MAPDSNSNLGNSNGANKPRVGVMLRQSVTGEKSSLRSAELDVLKDEYQRLTKHFKELHKHLKERHAAMVSTGYSRQALAKTMAAMSEATPLAKSAGSNDAAVSGVAASQSNYVNTMNALATSSHARADDFQQKGLDYMKQWQEVVTTRVNAELKRTDQLRRDADHYEAKVESLEGNAKKLREKGKEVPAATKEKLDRNQQKLDEAQKLYHHAATDLFLLLDEVVDKSWRDLHPLFLRLVQLELNATSDDYNLVQGDLKPILAQLKQLAQSKHINGPRLEQLEKSSPKNLSTRPNPANVRLSFGTDAPEKAPASPGKTKPAKATALLPNQKKTDNNKPSSRAPSNRGRPQRDQDSDDSSSSSSSEESGPKQAPPPRKSMADRMKQFGGGGGNSSNNKNSNSNSNKPSSSSNGNLRGSDGGGRPSRSAPGRAAKTASQHPPTTHDITDEFKNADPSQWNLTKQQFSGSFVYATKGKEEEVVGQPIAKGIDKIKKHPEKYLLLFYQSNMIDWPADQQRYILIHREGSSGYKPKGVGPKGFMTLYMQEFQALPPFKDDILPTQYRDEYTDNMTHQGRRLHNKTNKPLLPGRGMGCCDSPLIKIIGDVDPSDIHQGSVGDCWLLSGISSLAEFDGAIKHLFRKTPKLEQRPLPGANKYTVTLWDLPTWKEKDIIIDERLAAMPDGSGSVLSSKPSEDGELWVCYLEKALSIHCGGWDKITGGQCTHAWALMTGCKEQYTIRKSKKTGLYQCFGKYNPYERRWANHGNSPHDGEQSMWQMDWPKVGGGGDKDLELTEEELFQRMCAWDDVNYIVGAGCSDKGADGGLVDNHAYSVIEAHNDVAGTDIDLIKVRNPWGKGEIEDGMFDDDGPGWQKYPQIKRALNPVVADDGIFWVTKQEFFVFFSTVYLSASNMTEFLED